MRYLIAVLAVALAAILGPATVFVVYSKHAPSPPIMSRPRVAKPLPATPQSLGMNESKQQGFKFAYWTNAPARCVMVRGLDHNYGRIRGVVPEYLTVEPDGSIH
jgi:hypothetical protein